MKCPNCNQEIKSTARFCSHCGESLVTDTPQEETASQAAVAQNEAQNQPREFKAAVASSRKRNMSKASMIALIVLVTLLVSSVAYAAYYAVTTFVLPQVEQQQATDEAAAKAEEAKAAYDPIIQDYRGAYQTAQSGGLDWNSQSDLANRYPSVSQNAIQAWLSSGSTESSSKTIYYSIEDVNGDGIPELLIVDGETGYGPSHDYTTLYAMWSLVDGEPVCLVESAAPSPWREGIYLCENGVINQWAGYGSTWYCYYEQLNPSLVVSDSNAGGSTNQYAAASAGSANWTALGSVSWGWDNSWSGITQTDAQGIETTDRSLSDADRDTLLQQYHERYPSKTLENLTPLN